MHFPIFVFQRSVGDDVTLSRTSTCLSTNSVNSFCEFITVVNKFRVFAEFRTL